MKDGGRVPKKTYWQYSPLFFLSFPFLKKEMSTCLALFTLSGDQYVMNAESFANEKNRFHSSSRIESILSKAGKPAFLVAIGELDDVNSVIASELKAFSGHVRGVPEVELILGSGADFANPLKCKGDDEFYGWISALKAQFKMEEVRRRDTSIGISPSVAGIRTSTRIQVTDTSTEVVRKKKHVVELNFPHARLGVRLSLADELQLKGSEASELVSETKESRNETIRDKTISVFRVPVTSGSVVVTPEIHMSRIKHGDDIVFEAEVELPVKDMQKVTSDDIKALLTVTDFLLHIISPPGRGVGPARDR